MYTMMYFGWLSAIKCLCMIGSNYQISKMPKQNWTILNIALAHVSWNVHYLKNLLLK